MTAPLAHVVDGIGHELLAGTGLTINDHGGVRGRGAQNLFIDLLHGRALADDIAEPLPFRIAVEQENVFGAGFNPGRLESGFGMLAVVDVGNHGQQGTLAADMVDGAVDALIPALIPGVEHLEADGLPLLNLILYAKEAR